MTSAASSSASTDRRSAESSIVANAVVIKEEPIEEEVATYSIDVSSKAAADAQVKLEEVFNWSDKEKEEDDENSN